MASKKSARKRDPIAASERGAPTLTHVDARGRPRMVDVGDKPVTMRLARAEGYLRMESQTLSRLEQGRTPKGDPLVVARIAGIQAAKRTADLIPLCHPLALSHADVNIETDLTLPGLHVVAEVSVTGATGVEMEALTATTVALLTLYDMLKAIDRTLTIEGVRLLEKRGGRSGDWRAPTTPGG